MNRSATVHVTLRHFLLLIPLLIVVLVLIQILWILQFDRLVDNRPTSDPPSSHLLSLSFSYWKRNGPHSHHVVSVPNPTKTNTRLVIFAGPSKTGSSSIQTNLYDWTTKGLLEENHWAWVNPNKTCVAEHTTLCNIFFAQTNTKGWTCLSDCFNKHLLSKEDEKSNRCLKLQSCYQNELLRVLRRSEQQKAIFGTEHFANALQAPQETGVYDRSHAFHYIQHFMDLAAPVIQSKEEVTFVVTYRTPKIDHLTSQWKQYRDTRNQSSSYRDYLLSHSCNLKPLNPLHAAKVLAIDYGVKVVLLDLSGVERKGYDVSNVAACQILGLPCHLENMTLNFGGKAALPAVVNIRQDDLALNTLTLEEKSKIDSILRRLDCTSIHFLLNHPRVEILHPHALLETRNSCGREVNYSLAEARQDIRRVVG